LGHDDVLELTFNFVPEFNQTVTVQPDGYIGLKDLPAMYVDGMTLPDLSRALRQAYSSTLNDPQITVVLKQFDAPYFIANGELAHPGKYELRSDITLTQAVGIAGGFTHHAKHSQVVLFRRTSHGVVQAHLVDVKQMLKSRDLAEDIHLKPGDMLFVPQNTLSKIDKYFPASYLSFYGNASQF
jgi:polysaccharide export outer membrane protein